MPFLYEEKPKRHFPDGVWYVYPQSTTYPLIMTEFGSLFEVGLLGIIISILIKIYLVLLVAATQLSL